MTRGGIEATLAILFAVVVLVVGGIAVAVFVTISPVHTDSAAVPSTVASIQPGAFAGAVDESRQLARALLVTGDSTGFALGWKAEDVLLAGARTRLLIHRGTPVGGTIALMLFPELRLVIATTPSVTHDSGVSPFGLKVAESFARRLPPAMKPPRLATAMEPCPDRLGW